MGYMGSPGSFWFPMLGLPRLHLNLNPLGGTHQGWQEAFTFSGDLTAQGLHLGLWASRESRAASAAKLG